MLASIGATSKQIWKNVLFEGGVLGVIALPLGILCGVFAIWVTLLTVAQILAGRGLADIPLHLYVSWQTLAIAVLIAIITIYLS